MACVKHCDRAYLIFFFIIGQPVKFNVTVKPAPNFPLDLYLLMDLSYSMNNDLDHLKSLGGQIGETKNEKNKSFYILSCS